MKSDKTYKEGDRVLVTLFGGKKIRATIELIEEEGKDGESTADLIDCSDGE